MSTRLLVTNARVHTMDPAVPEAEAFLVEDGRIADIGRADAVRNRAAGAATLDLQGRTVAPGFIDGHAHLIAAGFAATCLNVFGKRTIRDILEAIRDDARTVLRGGWVVAVGFDDTMVADRRYPTAAELDEIAPDHPVRVERMDGHSCVLNTRALRALGVDSSWPGVERVDGELTGVLRADANNRAQAAFDAQIPREARESSFLRACRMALSAGITSVHGIEPAGADAEIALALRRETPLHTRLYVIADRVADIPAGAEGLKLFVDGSMDSHTALLFDPYADRPGTSGTFYQLPDALRALARDAEARGLQVITHAIGDRGIDEALRAYEGLSSMRRHRIEHFELPLPEHLTLCSERGIVVSTQPAFVHLWDYTGFYVARVGRDRARTIHPYRTMVDRGMRLCGGSDAPVTPLDPLLGIHAAVHHPVPSERLTPDQALRMFTIDAAWAGHEEAERGSISVGKVADFVVLGDDPLGARRDAINDIRVLETYVAGRRVPG